MSNPRTTAASSVREQKLARVIDREVAPIWHDRFARLLLRELPTDGELFALDVHSGPGHTTSELLQRLDESSRIVALGRDPWLMQVSKTRVRPEWKRRVYFKSGDIDDVTGMNDDTYDLTVANLVLGEQVVEWQPALAELVRVTKPGGQVMVTLPLHGTWQEVEDLFEELLRDEGMRKEVATLQKLRRRRPKPSHIVKGVEAIGLGVRDFVIEHERFELLFRSGREFLFAPVIEHGPLRLWKAILGRAEKPQALFWRFKEAIDTYYRGHVLSVTVIAGVLRLRLPGGSHEDNYAGIYWGRYPSLSQLWGVPGVEAADASEDEFEFDLDIDLDETDAAIDGLQPEDSAVVAAADSGTDLEPGGGFGRGFADIEVSGANELPAVEDMALGVDETGDDPFAGLLEELDAEAAAAAAIAAEDAEVEAAAARKAHSGKVATLGALGDESPQPGELPSSKSGRNPGESGASPLPGKLPSARNGRKPGESGVSALPDKLPPRSSLASKLPGRKPGESGVSPLPGKLPPPPKTLTGKLPPRPAGSAGSLASRLPRREKPEVSPPGVAPPRKPGDGGADSLLARLPNRKAGSVAPPVAPPVAAPPPAAPPPPQTGSVPTVGAKPKSPSSGFASEESDPFAAMLDDDDDIDDIDDIEELPADSLVGAEIVDDEDFADSFGTVAPDPSDRPPPRPPPPPPKPKK